MGKKKEGARIMLKMISSESDFYYMTTKNKRKTPDKLELKKYDPNVRKHVPFREKKV